MSFREKIEKASDYCKNNENYMMVPNHEEETVLLVRDCTNPVKVAQIG